MKIATIFSNILFYSIISTTSAGISIIGTNQVWDEDGENISIKTPSGSKAGDTLVLVTHRTDSLLPLELNGDWKRRAECFKTNNADDCQIASDCIQMVGHYCKRFRSGKGRDLAQVIYTRKATKDQTFYLNFAKGGPAWLILSTLRGVDELNPVRHWTAIGNDRSKDSAFPSIHVARGDMVILSQSFDDRVGKNVFQAPIGFKTCGYISGPDETGLLYAKLWNSDETITGKLITTGPGAPRSGQAAKDSLISISFAEGKVSDFNRIEKDSSSDGYKNSTSVNIEKDLSSDGYKNFTSINVEKDLSSDGYKNLAYISFLFPSLLLLLV